MHAPQAKKKKKELTIHNHTRLDEYYWLRERENPEVIEYLEAENAYTDDQLAETTDLQETLFQEMIGRLKPNDLSVPYRLRGYFYYTQFVEGKEYPMMCRKKDSLDNEEEIILDCNELAKDFEFFQMGRVEISPNNQMLSFSTDTIGRRNYDVYFKDLTTDTILEDSIKKTSGEIAWGNDNKTLFFVRKDEETLRPYQVFRYNLDQKDEEVKVFEDLDETFYVGLGKSKSEEYVIVQCDSTLSSEVWVLHADHPNSEFSVVTPREKDLEYAVGHYKDKFYIRTNLQAKNFCLMEVSVDNPAKENWKPLVPHRKEVLLESFSVYQDYLVLVERIKGLHNLRIIRWDGKDDYYIPMPEETYAAFLSINPDFDTQELRFAYSSLVSPSCVFAYRMDTKEKTLLKKFEVEGGYNDDEYLSERLFAPAEDGTEIPISIVYKKGLKRDGNSPCLLYGYGSYGSSMDAVFSSSRLSLLDRGFSFAIAHVRGGEEMGTYWYDEGKLLNKKNTFTDFNAAAKFLIAQKYTSSAHLYALGGSAGGLLMGAIVNMEPQLYHGICAAVPFVDVVTTMLDDTIPLTTGEYDEWGNPNDKAYYDYMLSYSPYDNVECKDYPAILVTTGLHDSQVQYWEPAKWVARLRDRKTDGNLLLMHCDMEVGHGGASGRFKPFRDVAREYAFFLHLDGIKS